MSDASTLRDLLRKTDASAPAIQATAGAMLKHYDKSPAVAVTEWRNAMHQARLDQHLPLLYVANESLQNSKRNRGNKFLEAFSPVLGQSLAHVCQENPDAVEKVRRVVKIWGDRHVFSVRFVNELLKGLEPYRNMAAAVGSRRPPASAPIPAAEVEGAGSFSPPSKPPGIREASPGKTPPSASSSSRIDFDKEMAMDDDDDDDDDTGFGGGNSDNDDDDASDDGGLFGDSGGDQLLKIELDLDKAASSAATSTARGNRKRRRPSASVGASTGTSKTKRRHTILSTSSLMELWNQVSTLQQRYDNTQTILAGITPEYLDESSVAEQIDTLVGDELLEQYKRVVMYEKRVVEQRKELHNIAQKRKALEQQAVRYLPWLEATLKQDQDDIEFCDNVMVQCKTFESIHGGAKEAREERLAEEARRQQDVEEKERKKQEEEERKKFMEIAMSKVTEAKPGMIWNKALGEYQYRNTDESWRD